MLPGAYNLALYRGDSYAWQFRIWSDADKTQPTDLTGVTAKAEIRDKSAGLTIMALECLIETPNIVHVGLTAEMWVAWTLAKGVWDLQLTWPTGEVITVAAGTVTVTADVTDSSAITLAAFR